MHLLGNGAAMHTMVGEHDVRIICVSCCYFALNGRARTVVFCIDESLRDFFRIVDVGEGVQLTSSHC